MKRARRKELKTNELSVYLNQIYEAVTRHATWLIAGVAVIVVVLVVGLLVQRNRHQALVDAWETCRKLREGDVVTDRALLDQARSLAAGYGDDSELGPPVLELEADLAYELALSFSQQDDRERKMTLFEEARSACERLLSTFGDRPEVAARARMRLAKIEESLAAIGQGKPERVRELYQQIIESGPNPYRELAEARVEELGEWLAPLKIVATRPAEKPATRPTAEPATRPASEGPGVTPAEERPAAPAPTPAVEPTVTPATKPATGPA